MGICVTCWNWCINTEERVKQFNRSGLGYCSKTRELTRQEDSCRKWVDYKNKPTHCNDDEGQETLE